MTIEELIGYLSHLPPDTEVLGYWESQKMPIFQIFTDSLDGRIVCLLDVDKHYDN